MNVTALRLALLAALDALDDTTTPAPSTGEAFEGVDLVYYFSHRGEIEAMKPGFGNRLMIEQYRRMDEARGTQPFDPSLRAGIMGVAGGSPNPTSWSTHGRILDAAQGGELNDGIGWTINGKPFRRFDYMGCSTVEKHQVLMDVWTSPLGMEWRADPLNAPVLPVGEPQI